MNDDQQATGTISKALKPARTAMFMIAVFSFFVNLLMLTGPLFMLQIYDRVLTSGSKIGRASCRERVLRLV